jgi:hypothetical protein
VRGRHAGILAATVLVVGAAVLVLALVRTDVASTRLAAGPAPAPAAQAATTTTATTPFEGTWVGSLADPDTTTVQVRLTVGGPARGVVLEVPGLRCTYRGSDPVPATGPVAVAEVRADGGARSRCAGSARIRLGAAGAQGPATDRVRYDLLASCDPSGCAPRRASGLLTAWRPGS